MKMKKREKPKSCKNNEFGMKLKVLVGMVIRIKRLILDQEEKVEVDRRERGEEGKKRRREYDLME